MGDVRAKGLTLEAKLADAKQKLGQIQTERGAVQLVSNLVSEAVKAGDINWLRGFSGQLNFGDGALTLWAERKGDQWEVKVGFHHGTEGAQRDLLVQGGTLEEKVADAKKRVESAGGDIERLLQQTFDRALGNGDTDWLRNNVTVINTADGGLPLRFKLEGGKWKPIEGIRGYGGGATDGRVEGATLGEVISNGKTLLREARTKQGAWELWKKTYAKAEAAEDRAWLGNNAGYINGEKGTVLLMRAFSLMEKRWVDVIGGDAPGGKIPDLNPQGDTPEAKIQDAENKIGQRMQTEGEVIDLYEEISGKALQENNVDWLHRSGGQLYTARGVVTFGHELRGEKWRDVVGVSGSFMAIEDVRAKGETFKAKIQDAKQKLEWVQSREKALQLVEALHKEACTEGDRKWLGKPMGQIHTASGDIIISSGRRWDFALGIRDEKGGLNDVRAEGKTLEKKLADAEKKLDAVAREGWTKLYDRLLGEALTAQDNEWLLRSQLSVPTDAGMVQVGSDGTGHRRAAIYGTIGWASDARAEGATTEALVADAVKKLRSAENGGVEGWKKLLGDLVAQAGPGGKDWLSSVSCEIHVGFKTMAFSFDKGELRAIITIADGSSSEVKVEGETLPDQLNSAEASLKETNSKDDLRNKYEALPSGRPTFIRLNEQNGFVEERWIPPADGISGRRVCSQTSHFVAAGVTGFSSFEEAKETKLIPFDKERKDVHDVQGWYTKLILRGMTTRPSPTWDRRDISCWYENDDGTITRKQHLWNESKDLWGYSVRLNGDAVTLTDPLSRSSVVYFYGDVDLGGGVSRRIDGIKMADKLMGEFRQAPGKWQAAKEQLARRFVSNESLLEDGLLSVEREVDGKVITGHFGKQDLIRDGKKLEQVGPVLTVRDRTANFSLTSFEFAKSGETDDVVNRLEQAYRSSGDPEVRAKSMEVELATIFKSEMAKSGVLLNATWEGNGIRLLANYVDGIRLEEGKFGRGALIAKTDVFSDRTVYYLNGQLLTAESNAPQDLNGREAGTKLLAGMVAAPGASDLVNLLKGRDGFATNRLTRQGVVGAEGVVKNLVISGSFKDKIGFAHLASAKFLTLLRALAEGVVDVSDGIVGSGAIIGIKDRFTGNAVSFLEGFARGDSGPPREVHGYALASELFNRIQTNDPSLKGLGDLKSYLLGRLDIQSVTWNVGDGFFIGANKVDSHDPDSRESRLSFYAYDPISGSQVNLQGFEKKGEVVQDLRVLNGNRTKEGLKDFMQKQEFRRDDGTKINLGPLSASVVDKDGHKFMMKRGNFSVYQVDDKYLALWGNHDPGKLNFEGERKRNDEGHIIAAEIKETSIGVKRDSKAKGSLPQDFKWGVLTQWVRGNVDFLSGQERLDLRDFGYGQSVIRLADGRQCPTIMDENRRLVAFQMDGSWRDAQTGRVVEKAEVIRQVLNENGNTTREVIGLESGKESYRVLLTEHVSSGDVSELIHGAQDYDGWKKMSKSPLIKRVELIHWTLFDGSAHHGNLIFNNTGKESGADETWQMTPQDFSTHATQLIGWIKSGQGSFSCQWGTFAGDGSFKLMMSYEYAVVPGVNKLKISAFDEHGNSVSALVRFYIAKGADDYHSWYTFGGYLGGEENSGRQTIEESLLCSVEDPGRTLQRVHNGWVIDNAAQTGVFDSKGNGIWGYGGRVERVEHLRSLVSDEYGMTRQVLEVSKTSDLGRPTGAKITTVVTDLDQRITDVGQAVRTTYDPDGNTKVDELQNGVWVEIEKVSAPLTDYESRGRIFMVAGAVLVAAGSIIAAPFTFGGSLVALSATAGIILAAVGAYYAFEHFARGNDLLGWIELGIALLPGVNVLGGFLRGGAAALKTFQAAWNAAKGLKKLGDVLKVFVLGRMAKVTEKVAKVALAGEHLAKAALIPSWYVYAAFQSVNLADNIYKYTKGEAGFVDIAFSALALALPLAGRLFGPAFKEFSRLTKVLIVSGTTLASAIAGGLINTYMNGPDNFVSFMRGFVTGAAVGLSFHLSLIFMASMKPALGRQVLSVAGGMLAGALAGGFYYAATGGKFLEGALTGALIGGGIALTILLSKGRVLIKEAVDGVTKDVWRSATPSLFSRILALVSGSATGAFAGFQYDRKQGGDGWGGLKMGLLLGAAIPYFALIPATVSKSSQLLSHGLSVAVVYGLIPVIASAGAYFLYSKSEGKNFFDHVNSLLPAIVVGLMIALTGRTVVGNLFKLEAFMLQPRLIFEAAVSMACAFGIFNFLGVGKLLFEFNPQKGWDWDWGKLSMSFEERMVGLISGVKMGLALPFLGPLAYQPASNIGKALAESGVSSFWGNLFGLSWILNAPKKELLAALGRAVLRSGFAGAIVGELYAMVRQLKNGGEINDLKSVLIGAAIGFFAGGIVLPGLALMSRGVLHLYRSTIPAGNFTFSITRGVSFIGQKILELPGEAAHVFHMVFAGWEGIVPIHFLSQTAMWASYLFGGELGLDRQTRHSLAQLMSTLAMFLAPMPEFLKNGATRNALRLGDKATIDAILRASKSGEETFELFGSPRLLVVIDSGLVAEAQAAQSALMKGKPPVLNGVMVANDHKEREARQTTMAGRGVEGPPEPETMVTQVLAGQGVEGPPTPEGMVTQVLVGQGVEGPPTPDGMVTQALAGRGVEGSPELEAMGTQDLAGRGVGGSPELEAMGTQVQAGLVFDQWAEFRQFSDVADYLDRLALSDPSLREVAAAFRRGIDDLGLAEMVVGSHLMGPNSLVEIMVLADLESKGIKAKDVTGTRDGDNIGNTSYRATEGLKKVAELRSQIDKADGELADAQKRLGRTGPATQRDEERGMNSGEVHAFRQIELRTAQAELVLARMRWVQRCGLPYSEFDLKSAEFEATSERRLLEAFRKNESIPITGRAGRVGVRENVDLARAEFQRGVGKEMGMASTPQMQIFMLDAKDVIKLHREMKDAQDGDTLQIRDGISVVLTPEIRRAVEGRARQAHLRNMLQARVIRVVKEGSEYLYEFRDRRFSLIQTSEGWDGTNEADARNFVRVANNTVRAMKTFMEAREIHKARSKEKQDIEKERKRGEAISDKEEQDRIARAGEEAGKKFRQDFESRFSEQSKQLWQMMSNGDTVFGFSTGGGKTFILSPFGACLMAMINKEVLNNRFVRTVRVFATGNKLWEGMDPIRIKDEEGFDFSLEFREDQAVGSFRMRDVRGTKNLFELLGLEYKSVGNFLDNEINARDLGAADVIDTTMEAIGFITNSAARIDAETQAKYNCLTEDTWVVIDEGHLIIGGPGYQEGIGKGRMDPGTGKAMVKVVEAYRGLLSEGKAGLNPMEDGVVDFVNGQRISPRFNVNVRDALIAGAFHGLSYREFLSQIGKNPKYSAFAKAMNDWAAALRGSYGNGFRFFSEYESCLRASNGEAPDFIRHIRENFGRGDETGRGARPGNGVEVIKDDSEYVELYMAGKPKAKRDIKDATPEDRLGGFCLKYGLLDLYKGEKVSETLQSILEDPLKPAHDSQIQSTMHFSQQYQAAALRIRAILDVARESVKDDMTREFSRSSDPAKALQRAEEWVQSREGQEKVWERASSWIGKINWEKVHLSPDTLSTQFGQFLRDLRMNGGEFVAMTGTTASLEAFARLGFNVRSEGVRGAELKYFLYSPNGGINPLAIKIAESYRSKHVEQELKECGLWDGKDRTFARAFIAKYLIDNLMDVTRFSQLLIKSKAKGKGIGVDGETDNLLGKVLRGEEGESVLPRELLAEFGPQIRQTRTHLATLRTMQSRANENASNGRFSSGEQKFRFDWGAFDKALKSFTSKGSIYSCFADRFFAVGEGKTVRDILTHFYNGEDGSYLRDPGSNLMIVLIAEININPVIEAVKEMKAVAEGKKKVVYAGSAEGEWRVYDPVAKTDNAITIERAKELSEKEGAIFVLLREQRYGTDFNKLECPVLKIADVSTNGIDYSQSAGRGRNLNPQFTYLLRGDALRLSFSQKQAMLFNPKSGRIGSGIVEVTQDQVVDRLLQNTKQAITDILVQEITSLTRGFATYKLRDLCPFLTGEQSSAILDEIIRGNRALQGDNDLSIKDPSKPADVLARAYKEVKQRIYELTQPKSDLFRALRSNPIARAILDSLRAEIEGEMTAEGSHGGLELVGKEEEGIRPQPLALARTIGELRAGLERINASELAETTLAGSGGPERARVKTCAEFKSAAERTLGPSATPAQKRAVRDLERKLSGDEFSTERDLGGGRTERVLNDKGQRIAAYVITLLTGDDEGRKRVTNGLHHLGVNVALGDNLADNTFSLASALQALNQTNPRLVEIVGLIGIVFRDDGRSQDVKLTEEERSRIFNASLPEVRRLVDMGVQGLADEFLYLDRVAPIIALVRILKERGGEELSLNPELERIIQTAPGKGERGEPGVFQRALEVARALIKDQKGRFQEAGQFLRNVLGSIVQTILGKGGSGKPGVFQRASEAACALIRDQMGRYQEGGKFLRNVKGIIQWLNPFSNMRILSRNLKIMRGEFKAFLSELGTPKELALMAAIVNPNLGLREFGRIHDSKKTLADEWDLEHFGNAKLGDLIALSEDETGLGPARFVDKALAPVKLSERRWFKPAVVVLGIAGALAGAVLALVLVASPASLVAGFASFFVGGAFVKPLVKMITGREGQRSRERQGVDKGQLAETVLVGGASWAAGTYLVPPLLAAVAVGGVTATSGLAAIALGVALGAFLLNKTLLKNAPPRVKAAASLVGMTGASALFLAAPGAWAAGEAVWTMLGNILGYVSLPIFGALVGGAGAVGLGFVGTRVVAQGAVNLFTPSNELRETAKFILSSKPVKKYQERVKQLAETLMRFDKDMSPEEAQRKAQAMSGPITDDADDIAWEMAVPFAKRMGWLEPSRVVTHLGRAAAILGAIVSLGAGWRDFIPSFEGLPDVAGLDGFSLGLGFVAVLSLIGLKMLMKAGEVIPFDYKPVPQGVVRARNHLLAYLAPGNTGTYDDFLKAREELKLRLGMPFNPLLTDADVNRWFGRIDVKYAADPVKMKNIVNALMRIFGFGPAAPADDRKTPRRGNDYRRMLEQEWNEARVEANTQEFVAAVWKNVNPNDLAADDFDARGRALEVRVKGALAEVADKMKKQGADIDAVIEEAAGHFGLEPAQLYAHHLLSGQDKDSPAAARIEAVVQEVFANDAYKETPLSDSRLRERLLAYYAGGRESFEARVAEYKRAIVEAAGGGTLLARQLDQRPLSSFKGEDGKLMTLDEFLEKNGGLPALLVSLYMALVTERKDSMTQADRELVGFLRRASPGEREQAREALAKNIGGRQIPLPEFTGGNLEEPVRRLRYHVLLAGMEPSGRGGEEDQGRTDTLVKFYDSLLVGGEEATETIRTRLQTDPQDHVLKSVLRSRQAVVVQGEVGDVLEFGEAGHLMTEAEYGAVLNPLVDKAQEVIAEVKPFGEVTLDLIIEGMAVQGVPEDEISEVLYFALRLSGLSPERAAAYTGVYVGMMMEEKQQADIGKAVENKLREMGYSDDDVVNLYNRASQPEVLSFLSQVRAAVLAANPGLLATGRREATNRLGRIGFTAERAKEILAKVDNGEMTRRDFDLLRGFTVKDLADGRFTLEHLVQFGEFEEALANGSILGADGNITRAAINAWFGDQPAEALTKAYEFYFDGHLTSVNEDLFEEVYDTYTAFLAKTGRNRAGPFTPPTVEGRQILREIARHINDNGFSPTQAAALQAVQADSNLAKAAQEYSQTQEGNLSSIVRTLVSAGVPQEQAEEFAGKVSVTEEFDPRNPRDPLMRMLNRMTEVVPNDRRNGRRLVEGRAETVKLLVERYYGEIPLAEAGIAHHLTLNELDVLSAVAGLPAFAARRIFYLALSMLKLDRPVRIEETVSDKRHVWTVFDGGSQGRRGASAGSPIVTLERVRGTRELTVSWPSSADSLVLKWNEEGQVVDMTAHATGRHQIRIQDPLEEDGTELQGDRDVFLLRVPAGRDVLFAMPGGHWVSIGPTFVMPDLSGTVVGVRELEPIIIEKAVEESVKEAPAEPAAAQEVKKEAQQPEEELASEAEETSPAPAVDALSARLKRPEPPVKAGELVIAISGQMDPEVAEKRGLASADVVMARVNELLHRGVARILPSTKKPANLALLRDSEGRVIDVYVKEGEEWVQALPGAAPATVRETFLVGRGAEFYRMQGSRIRYVSGGRLQGDLKDSDNNNISLEYVVGEADSPILLYHALVLRGVPREVAMTYAASFAIQLSAGPIGINAEFLSGQLAALGFSVEEVDGIVTQTLEGSLSADEFGHVARFSLADIASNDIDDLAEFGLFEESLETEGDGVITLEAFEDYFGGRPAEEQEKASQFYFGRPWGEVQPSSYRKAYAAYNEIMVRLGLSESAEPVTTTSIEGRGHFRAIIDIAGRVQGWGMSAYYAAAIGTLRPNSSLARASQKVAMRQESLLQSIARALVLEGFPVAGIEAFVRLVAQTRRYNPQDERDPVNKALETLMSNSGLAERIKSFLYYGYYSDFSIVQAGFDYHLRQGDFPLLSLVANIDDRRLVNVAAELLDFGEDSVRQRVEVDDEKIVVRFVVSDSQAESGERELARIEEFHIRTDLTITFSLTRSSLKLAWGDDGKSVYLTVHAARGERIVASEGAQNPEIINDHRILLDDLAAGSRIRLMLVGGRETQIGLTLVVPRLSQPGGIPMAEAPSSRVQEAPEAEPQTAQVAPQPETQTTSWWSHVSRWISSVGQYVVKGYNFVRQLAIKGYLSARHSIVELYSSIRNFSLRQYIAEFRRSPRVGPADLYRAVLGDVEAEDPAVQALLDENGQINVLREASRMFGLRRVTHMPGTEAPANIAIVRGTNGNVAEMYVRANPGDPNSAWVPAVSSVKRQGNIWMATEKVELYRLDGNTLSRTSKSDEPMGVEPRLYQISHWRAAAALLVGAVGLFGRPALSLLVNVVKGGGSLALMGVRLVSAHPVTSGLLLVFLIPAQGAWGAVIGGLSRAVPEAGASLAGTGIGALAVIGLAVSGGFYARNRFSREAQAPGKEGFVLGRVEGPVASASEGVEYVGGKAVSIASKRELEQSLDRLRFSHETENLILSPVKQVNGVIVYGQPNVLASLTFAGSDLPEVPTETMEDLAEALGRADSSRDIQRMLSNSVYGAWMKAVLINPLLAGQELPQSVDQAAVRQILEKAGGATLGDVESLVGELSAFKAFVYTLVAQTKVVATADGLMFSEEGLNSKMERGVTYAIIHTQRWSNRPSLRDVFSALDMTETFGGRISEVFLIRGPQGQLALYTPYEIRRTLLTTPEPAQRGVRVVRDEARPPESVTQVTTWDRLSALFVRAAGWVRGAGGQPLLPSLGQLERMVDSYFDVIAAMHKSKLDLDQRRAVIREMDKALPTVAARAIAGEGAQADLRSLVPSLRMIAGFDLEKAIGRFFGELRTPAVVDTGAVRRLLIATERFGDVVAMPRDVFVREKVAMRQAVAEGLLHGFALMNAGQVTREAARLRKLVQNPANRTELTKAFRAMIGYDYQKFLRRLDQARRDQLTFMTESEVKKVLEGQPASARDRALVLKLMIPSLFRAMGLAVGVANDVSERIQRVRVVVVDNPESEEVPQDIREGRSEALINKYELTTNGVTRYNNVIYLTTPAGLKDPQDVLIDHIGKLGEELGHILEDEVLARYGLKPADVPVINREAFAALAASRGLRSIPRMEPVADAADLRVTEKIARMQTGQVLFIPFDEVKGRLDQVSAFVKRIDPRQVRRIVLIAHTPAQASSVQAQGALSVVLDEEILRTKVAGEAPIKTWARLNFGMENAYLVTHAQDINALPVQLQALIGGMADLLLPVKGDLAGQLDHLFKTAALRAHQA